MLKDVFEEFPNFPINIDIKINDDQLIYKVSELVKFYKRQEYTVWGNFNDEITLKCYKVVSLLLNIIIIILKCSLCSKIYYFYNSFVIES